MGTMAGNHSEILSKEPQCWLEAAEPGPLHDPSDLPGLAAHPCPPPTPETSAMLLTRCPSAWLLSRKSSSEEQQPPGLCPGDHCSACLTPPPALEGESGALLSPPSVPSGLGKVLLLIRRSSHSKGICFLVYFALLFLSPGACPCSVQNSPPPWES